jgi:hypothetical protein
MTIEADLFRSIFARLPAGVAVVAALGSDGIPRGLTSTADQHRRLPGVG